MILLLNFNTLPIYRKRSKRFAKIPKGAPTYSMVLKQSVLGGVRGTGPWVDDMRMAVSHPSAKFAIEIHFCEIL